jgi:hypothetical protein
MQLKPKYGERLYTKNFTTTNSRAVASADFDEKNKIIELEWRDDPENKIYHYLDAKKAEWKKIIELGMVQGHGLGEYLNKYFKNPYTTPKRDYYELIVDGKHEDL